MTEPVTLIPHVWVQPLGIGDLKMLAGQVMTSDGRQATYKTHGADGRGWTTLCPIWLRPRTQEGLDQLFDQLIADAQRAMKGAA